MTPYTTVVFLHLVGAVGLFVGYGMEWVLSALWRKAGTVEQARAWLAAYRLSLPISGPALLLLILTGGYLASKTAEGMKAAWISATLVGIVVALGIGFGMILPRMKRIRAALEKSGAGVLSVEAAALLRAPVLGTLIRVRAMIAMGIVWLMAVKPGGLGEAFGELGVAVVVGVLFAGPLWRKG
jgi:Predicted integral membrane protein (DUF2269)